MGQRLKNILRERNQWIVAEIKQFEMTQIGKRRCTQFLQIISLQVAKTTRIDFCKRNMGGSGFNGWNYSLTKFCKSKNNSDGKYFRALTDRSSTTILLSPRNVSLWNVVSAFDDKSLRINFYFLEFHHVSGLLFAKLMNLHIDNVNGNNLISWYRLHPMVPAIETLRADHTTAHLPLTTLSPRTFIATAYRPNRLLHRTETPLQFFNTSLQLIYNFIISMRFASGICGYGPC